MVKEELQSEVEKLPKVPYEAAAEYDRQAEALIGEVNSLLSMRDDINELIGGNPLSAMETNHENHATFMVNVFKLNDFNILIQTVPWVYRSYSSRGFSFDYFPVALRAWIRAVERHIRADLANPVVQVYKWLLDKHETMIDISKQPSSFSVSLEKPWNDIQSKFLSALLQGDHRQCLKLAESSVLSRQDLQDFYLKVMQPSMYKIGDQWETGQISVAHEHLASAIVSRVMASLYPRFITVEQTKGKAVITACPNEYHEMGARMIADFLELEGWNVRYLGANVPAEELVSLLIEEKPYLLGISVVMPFNIDKAVDLIEKVKSNARFTDIKILVGGKIFTENKDLWKRTGADDWAPDGRSAIAKASNLWEMVENES